MQDFFVAFLLVHV